MNAIGWTLEMQTGCQVKCNFATEINCIQIRKLVCLKSFLEPEEERMAQASQLDSFVIYKEREIV
jgi:hypothetical protein